MKLRPLEAIVNGFILAVGITRPTPEKKRIAKLYIATGLGSVVAIAVLFVFLISRLN
jgi:hypothetical protein